MTCHPQTPEIKTLAMKFLLPLMVLCMGLSPLASAEFRYDREYPAIGYLSTPLTDPVTQLIERIQAGEVELEYVKGRGYLDSLLEALNIDPSSQRLVFSKTSKKRRLISAETPRAVYFNDEVHVAWVQGSRSLELVAMDPNVGPVFYTLEQNSEVQGSFERETNTCLRCHDSYSFSGGGVPRFMMSTVLANEQGEIVSHEVNLITDTSTPISRRWGGWYVTGQHGEQANLGNLIIRNRTVPNSENLLANGNREDLSEFLDLDPYLSEHSDIVALLVVEHQVEAYNAIIKANYEARSLLHEKGADAVSRAQLEAIAEPLVQSLFMAHEAPLGDAVSGTSGFTEYFQGLGPFDSQGRSLRELDLQTRTFRYPLSYLVYSRGFKALPQELKDVVYQRMDEVLRGAEADGVEGGEQTYGHLSAQDRRAIREILLGTSAEFRRYTS